MKKIILFVLALILACYTTCAFGASTEAIIYVVNELPDGYEDYDEDGNITNPAYAESIADALEKAETFAGEDSNFAEVTIIFRASTELEETITFDSLSTVKKLILSGNTSNIRLTAPEGKRHIIAENSALEFELSSIILAGNNGGGISVKDGTVIINGVTFQGIDATANEDSEENNGGAMKITGGNVSFSGTNNFTGNTANNGGAIYAATDNDVNFQEGTHTFENNTANENGGALYIADASNTSESSYNSNNNSVRASNFIIAPFTVGVAVNFNFIGNVGFNGGAVHIMPFGILVLGGIVNFRNNTAFNNGGAICVYGRIIDSSSTVNFTGNKAGSTVYTTSTTDPTNSGLSTSGFGGAIYFSSFSSIASNLGQTEFYSNTAPSGGAVYVNRGTLNFNNTATFGASGSGNNSYTGGALFLNGGSTNFNSYVSFDHNSALDDGGALYTVQNGTEALNFTSPVSFTGNTGNSDNGNVGDGGAVWWGMDVTTEFFKTFNIAGGSVTFTNNKTDGSPTTYQPANDAANGGAIYIAGSGTLTIDTNIDYQFSGNTAYNKGGVIYTDTANVTFSGVTISAQNTASNVGGGLAASASGLITVENSVITQQSAYAGGAIYATNIEITSSDFTNNSAATTNGGAVYAYPGGMLTVKTSRFMQNTAQNTGGAIYADASTINIDDSYFQSNKAKASGGAIEIENQCTSVISSSTFETNQSGSNGGAVCPYGSISVTKCYFTGNYASGMGGAVYFSQTGSGNGIFAITSSMLQGNIAGGSGTDGSGGALYLNVDVAEIDSCTFDQNSVTGGTNAYGGAVYFDVSGTASASESTIVNSTFTANTAAGGTNYNYGGALYTAGKINVISSAFTMGNSATDRGGAIYISSSLTKFMATIAVGNTASIGSDIYAETNTDCDAGFYNRVGIYGTGGSNSPGSKFSGGNGNKENTSWITSTFYGSNGLADNIWDASKPPMVGCSVNQILLQTLMLDEDANLPLDCTAIDIIEWNLRFQLPQFDQRGVDRWNNRNHIEIGPMYFGSGGGTPSEPITTYIIQSVTMSGIPNTLRSIGQTASLIALIRYTNGRTAYGGNDSGYEPIVWTSSNPNIVRIDQKGNITALAVTPNNSYVTITVSTKRNTAGGTPATDSRAVRVLGQYSYLNISPVYQNYLASYIQEIAEYDISLGLADVNTSGVKSSSFQREFKAAWKADKATQITDLTTSTPTFSTRTSYNVSGYVPSKRAAANINYQNRSNGDIFPLVYTWNFSGSEIKALLGSDLSEKTFNAKLAEELFNVLRIDFQGTGKTFQVVGGSGVSAKDAYTNQALTLTKADGNKGVSIQLTAYLANVEASGTNADGVQFMGSGSRKLLVVPDGTNDGAIAGSMWMIQKGSSPSTPDTPSVPDTPDTPDTPSKGNSGGGSGGGGCNASGLGLGVLAMFFMFRRKR